MFKKQARRLSTWTSPNGLYQENPNNKTKALDIRGNLTIGKKNEYEKKVEIPSKNKNTYYV